MTTTELLAHLRSLEIELWVEDDRLRFSAPKGALTPELRAELAAHKAEIMALLRQIQIPSIRPVPRDAPLPLSFAQQRLWFLHQVQPDSPAYNDFRIQQLEGPLDVAALNQSLTEVVRRHEVLRTVFAVQADQPVQVINPAQAVALPLIDLQGLPVDEREAEAMRLARLEMHHIFDLARGPLLRAVLLRLHADVHVLVLTIHHIVTDGWSFGVLFRELSVLYAAFSSGLLSPLAEMSLQYGDYAVWQRSWLQGAVLENLLGYWHQQLHPEGTRLPVLQLPTDHPRPAKPTNQGAIHEFVLPPALHARLAALSQQEGATLFMTLLTAFQILLARYSNQTDIVVGTAMANRTRAETEALIGFFVNQLVLRTDLSGNPLFREALKRVREVCLGAYAHQDLPFEELVKALNPERRINQSPLFQVEIIYENTAMPTLALPGLAAQSLGDQLPMARFDLVLAFQEDAHRLSGTLVYSTELFAAATMTRLLGHYLTLLEGIADNPDRRLADLPILTKAERRQLLVDWNNTTADISLDQCVHQLFAAQALRTPDAIALVMDEQQVTYQTLEARANQLAHYLQKLGVGPEVRVGLCLHRSLDLIVGLLGILKAGGAYVPLDPAYPQERLAFMLADSRVPLVLTQEHLLASLPASQARRVCFDQIGEQLAQEPVVPPASMVCADNLAYVIYTSGSTGRPKGVLVTQHGLGNLVHAQVRAFDVGSDSRVLQFASISFDASVSEVLTALLTGATLVLAARDDMLPGPALLRLLREQAISVITLPPSALAVLPDEDLPALRTLVVAGEACSPALAERWSHGRRFVNAYGPTEATVCATIAEAYAGSQNLTIGRPISNTQVYVLDQHLQPAPIGVPGEIYIAGVNLARGYLNRPELTAEKFIPDPFTQTGGARLYRTGDWARYRASGDLEFLGRRDDQVKLRGFRIELGEVEAVLEQHAAVREAAVVVREDVPGDQRLVAYVVENREPGALWAHKGQRRDDASTDTGSRFSVLCSPQELRVFLAERLPNYMVPSTFVILDALPLTAQGKVDRRALPQPEITATLADTFVAPRTPVEERLAESWAGVLRLERVGVHDNFFDMGGHSLLATQVISRVRDLFQVELTLRSLLETPTIAEIAVTIENLILDELEALPDEELGRLIQA